jgi:D-sedoheptulose 7-phosphate isomerase
LEYVGKLEGLLKTLSVKDAKGEELGTEPGMARWADLTVSIRDAGRMVFFVGNGASASMASHASADLAKNARVHTQVFTDLSLITALANDISYEDVYAEPLRHCLRVGDMLVAISSSGNSPNIVKACDVVRQKEGIIVTLSAMRGDNAIRSRGDLNFYVPADTYGLAETTHAAALHYWIDKVVG